MAVTQGQPAQVVNIGLGIKQLKVEPKGTSVPVFFESLSHKVRYHAVCDISADSECCTAHAT